MKFGKYLASRQLELPEYSGHFIDYKALKKLIKHLGMPAASLDFSETPSTPTQSQIQAKLKENKASFFFKVKRELDKVNSFYLEKQANLTVNLDLLMMKKNELLSKSAQLALQSSDHSSLNFKNSILYLNLYQSFKKIHQDLSRLQQFIELNEAGFLKVVKKWDKRSKSHTKELFIQTAVSVQPVFHKNEINELSDLVTLSLFDLESIMDGDYSALKSASISELSMASALTNRTGSITKLEQDATVESTNLSYHGPGQFNTSRHSSLSGFYHNEIDDLYSSFVNVATTKIPDMSVLERWFAKVESSSEDGSGKEKLSKIFILAISNLKISDAFLEAFLNHVHYDIDFTIDTNDLNTKPIIHECCSIPPASSIDDNLHVVINNGVKVVNSSDSISHTRVFIVKHVIENSSPSSLKDLLAVKDFNGRTCLHYAAQNNRQDLLEILLPHFPVCHIDDLDKDSMSALLLAISFDNFDMITTLISYGSNCYPETSESKLQYLPINYACKFGNYNTLEYLLRSGNSTPEMINRQDVEGLLPLHVIARSGNFKLIKLLIQYGATINHLDGLNKWPPIFYAALEGHAKTTHELIKFGARLDIVDEDGYNVLYYCVVEGHIEVLNHLLTYKMEFPPSNDNPNKSDHARHEDTSVSLSIVPLSILDEGDDLEDSGDPDKNTDAIPHLELPPPILPLRRYGHSFLEQKVLIELIFPVDSHYIHLFDLGTELKPGRITISSNLSDIVPRNILLPASDGQKGTTNCMFQTDVDSLNGFRIDFEIFPKFGTRLIAKTTALNFSQIDTSSPEINSILLPLFDIRLRNIGELTFNYQIIFPFSGTLLETTKYDTYWKSSASFVKRLPGVNGNAAGSLSPNNFLSPNSINANRIGSTPLKPKLIDVQPPVTFLNSNILNSSFVTATSLSGEYLRVKVCLLNDGTPVICPHWAIAVTDNIELYLPNLSLKQLISMTTSLFDYDKVLQDLSRMKSKDLLFVKKLLKIMYIPLETVLKVLDPGINLSIEIIFPSLFELDNLPFAGNIQLNLNKFIDITLVEIFEHVRSVKQANDGSSRSLIFLSSNSIVCKILNWKQPNYPVFLIMNGIVYNNSKNVFEARTANGLLMDEIKNEPSVKEVVNSPTSNTLQSKLKYQLLANDQELTVRSIKEATGFIMNNNLMGVITSIHLLNLVPKLIPLIRSRGLVLVASNDLFDSEDSDFLSHKDLDTYTRTDINGLRFDDVLSFKNGS
ncbi:hypothetical protein METBIDRAFT_79792 [Metschnikowia bicuspidata var. bicuspidata NRRL YB-4993]|uniref:SPX-domain-containing protein n=1 Tax=Metschnikowia bicuspidata var. bicuspidata NRRL YB-4993 TaxID=869754 RepID=A0A1A0H5N6_9ASCO|nr:hypothetical protein METBIDRAFT_79792 [Metschnikowia bicuspidata var. bicuspidata NRRL YB-4993]OBA19265.1 hypothetical protein METBIDRAFT_79792 [Metschnikowia bicuspidata var. bicuspidata NRRL YB-4993]